VGRTPDRSDGPRRETKIIFEDAASAENPGELAYDGSSFQMRDATGPFNPRSGGSGLTEGQHENLDTLVHEIAETCWTEVVRSLGRVTDIIVWETSAKLKKVRETNITRSGGQVDTIVTKQYDAAGVLIANQTITRTVTRSSGQVASIDAVQS
jgi:hypothetical protein